MRIHDILRVWGIAALLGLTGADFSAQAETTFDFGRITQKDMPQHWFMLKNESGKSLQVAKVTTPCRELQILSYPEVVQPGGTGRLEVRLVPTRPGAVACDIEVTAGGPAADGPVFRVEGEVERFATDGPLRSVSDMPENLLLRKLRGAESETRITVSEVLAAREQNRDIILIDVRHPKEFDKFWITGALNIPLYLVKTKSFLKSKPLVLLNEGWAYARLEEERKQLAALGFEDVSILEGGLNAWRRAGAPLAGDPFAIGRMAEIPAKSYFLDRHFTHWLAVDAAPEADPESSFYIPEAVHIPYSGDDEAFLGEIRRRAGNHIDGPLPHILIFDESGKRYGKIARLAEEDPIGNIYYLEGGLPAYKRFLRQQVLLRHPRKMQSGSEVCQTCR